MAFPAQRLRRLRQNEGIRGLVRENELSANKFILPLFAVPGSGIRKEIAALPGNYHFSVDELVHEACAAKDLGIPAVLLFGLPATKDEQASGAYAQNGIVQACGARVEALVPDIVLITDVVRLRIHTARPLRIH